MNEWMNPQPNYKSEQCDHRWEKSGSLLCLMLCGNSRFPLLKVIILQVKGIGRVSGEGLSVLNNAAWNSIRSGFSVRHLRFLKLLSDAWAQSWHGHSESFCGMTRFDWIHSNLCLKPNRKGFGLLLSWLGYLHKYNMINISFMQLIVLWLVLTVTQKS